MVRRRMLIVFTFALLSLIHASVAELSLQEQIEIRKAVIDRFQTDRELKEVEIYQDPKQKDIFAVLWDDGLWFKSLRVIKFKNGAITWVSELDSKSDWGDRSILTAGWKTAPNIGITVLEVYTSTHKGNGAYMIYKLNEQRLEQLLNVRSIGRYDYSQSARTPGVDNAAAHRVGKITKATDDSLEEIEVSGAVQYFDASGKNVVKTAPLKQVFKWNSAKKCFEEDLAKRKGDAEFLSFY